MQLDNTSAIVTGAASGLGAATAAALAAQGARVFGLDLEIADGPDIGKITYLAADVTREEQVAAAVAAAAAEGPLRTVVNCAGIAPSARIHTSTGGRSGWTPHCAWLPDDQEAPPMTKTMRATRERPR